jgi:hypothetical protein
VETRQNTEQTRAYTIKEILKLKRKLPKTKIVANLRNSKINQASIENKRVNYHGAV